MILLFRYLLCTNFCFRDVTSGRQYCSVPLEDQHAALNLLLELALQKGSLSSILDVVILLLNLWDKQTHLDNNRYYKNHQMYS